MSEGGLIGYIDRVRFRVKLRWRSRYSVLIGWVNRVGQER